MKIQVQKLIDGGHDREAVPILDAYLSGHPDDQEALMSRAEALEQTEQTQKALRDVNHLLDLEKKSFRAYKLRARILVELGKAKEGLADLNKAEGLAETKTQKYWIYYDRGKIWRILGNFPNACQDFAKAIAQKPNPGAYQQRGCTEVDQHRYPEAIKDFSSAITGSKFGDVNLHAYYSLRAQAYRKSGDLKHAAEDDAKGKSNIDAQFGNFFAPTERLK